MMHIFKALAGVAVLAIGASTPGYVGAQSVDTFQQRENNREELRLSCQVEQRALQKPGVPADDVRRGNDTLVDMDREQLQQERERVTKWRNADPVWALRSCGIEVRQRQLDRAAAGLPPASGLLPREKKAAGWMDQIRRGCAAEYAAVPASLKPDEIVSIIAKDESQKGLLGYLKRDARDASTAGRLWACAERVRLSEWGPLPADLATPLPPAPAPGTRPGAAAAARPAVVDADGPPSSSNPFACVRVEKPGQFRNQCPFPVYFTYCGVNPEKDSWISDCTQQKMTGLLGAAAGGVQGGFTRAEKVYMFACEKPEIPRDVKYIPGKGLHGSCK